MQNNLQNKYKMQGDVLFDLEIFIPQVRDGKVYSSKDLMTMAQNANMRVSSGAEIPVCIHHKPNKEIPDWKKPIPIGILQNFRVRHTNHLIANNEGQLQNKTVPCIYADVHGLNDNSRRELLFGNLPHRSIGLKPVQESPEIPEHTEIDHLALMSPSESPWIKFPKLTNNSIDAGDVEYPKAISNKSKKVFEGINYEFNVFEGEIMTPEQKRKSKKSKKNEQIDNQNIAKKTPEQEYLGENFEYSPESKESILTAMARLVNDGMEQDQASAAANQMYQDGALDAEGNFAAPTIEDVQSPPPIGADAQPPVDDVGADDQLIQIFSELKNDIAEIKEFIMGGEEETTETTESPEDIAAAKEQEQDANFEADQKAAKKKLVLPIENFEAQLDLVNFKANENGGMYNFNKQRAIDIVEAVNSGDPAKAIDAISKLMPVENVEGYTPPVNFENPIDNPGGKSGTKGKPIDADWNTEDSKGKSPSKIYADLHPNKTEADRKFAYYGVRCD